MRVVVLGASGFVGSALMTALRMPVGSIEPIPLTRKDYDIITGVLPSLEPGDVVVNSVSASEGDLGQLLNVNAWGPIRVAEICRDHQVRFVHLSSGAAAAVADGLSEAPQRQDPADPYALSKHLGELGVRAIGAGFATIVRLFFPYGPRQSDSRLIPRLIRLIREGEAISVDPDGGPRINLSHVDDVGRLLVSDFILTEPKDPVTNLASDHILSIEEIARALASSMGRALRVTHRESASPKAPVQPYRTGEWRDFDASELV